MGKVKSGFGFGTCFVHGTPFPRASLDSHHIRTQASGGSDDPDNLVDLCALCHETGHRVASMVRHRRNAEAEETAQALFPSQPARLRFKQIVRGIVESEVLAKDLGTGKQEHVLQLVLTPDTFVRLKSLAQDLRHNGRPMGVARYVEGILQHHLRQKGLL